MTKAVRTFLPKNRIESLVKRPGGISKEAALEGAATRIEALRDDSIVGIAEAIDTIENVLGSNAAVGLDGLGTILRHAGRIVTLSETYNYNMMAMVARSLCDLAQRFHEAGSGKSAPMLVHSNALRLVMPPRAIAQSEAERILGELSRILVFFDCVPRDEIRLNALKKLDALGIRKN